MFCGLVPYLAVSWSDAISDKALTNCLPRYVMAPYLARENPIRNSALVEFRFLCIKMFFSTKITSLSKISPSVGAGETYIAEY